MAKKELSEKLDEIADEANDLVLSTREAQDCARRLQSAVEDIDLDTLTEDEEDKTE